LTSGLFFFLFCSGMFCMTDLSLVFQIHYHHYCYVHEIYWFLLMLRFVLQEKNLSLCVSYKIWGLHAMFFGILLDNLVQAMFSVSNGAFSISSSASCLPTWTQSSYGSLMGPSHQCSLTFSLTSWMRARFTICIPPLQAPSSVMASWLFSGLTWACINTSGCEKNGRNWCVLNSCNFFSSMVHFGTSLALESSHGTSSGT
jgi:hypothetical protein